MLDRTRSLDLGEWSMNDDHLLAGDDAREQQCHCLAVLAARGVDRDKRAAANHLPALERDGDMGSGMVSIPV